MARRHSEYPRNNASLQEQLDFHRNTLRSTVILPHRNERPRQTFILCFDGTNNKFSGTDADSNILKIYRMLDRNEDDQFHYYQPGIGTYVVVDNATKSSSRASRRARLKSWYMKAKDSAIGEPSRYTTPCCQLTVTRHIVRCTCHGRLQVSNAVLCARRRHLHVRVLAWCIYCSVSCRDA
jgi:hypothetical protein